MTIQTLEKYHSLNLVQTLEIRIIYQEHRPLGKH